MRGNVRKRVNKAGVSWQVRVEYPPDPLTGQRVSRAESFPTEDEAHRRLAAWLVELHGGVAAEARTITVGQHLAEWLQVYAKPNVRASTYRSYEQQVRLYLTPALGTHPLRKLRPVHIQSTLTALRERGGKDGTGLSARSVRTSHQVLHQALDHAVAWGLLSSNPADVAKPPRACRAPIHIWDGDQLRHFLATAEDDNTAWGPLWLLAIATGMRQGELLGLPWANVDLARGRLHVTRTLTTAGTPLAPVFGEPKTAAGRRVIPLDGRCLGALREHRTAQVERRLRLGPAWRDYDLVLTTEDGGPLNPSNLNRRLTQLAGQTGLRRIRFHGLRHSHATLLLREGVPVKIVSERLGHASIAITLDTYAHVLPDMQQMAVDALEMGLFQTARGRAVDANG